ncbi:MAG TPA: hypothetical protein VND90_09705 [Terracidiphilus sp.]|nr:hypothetical protein [Terracidiphilus sp.]
MRELTSLPRHPGQPPTGVLVVAAAVAGVIPARRAASIDPARTLRID